MATSQHIDFTAFRADFAEAMKALEAKYGFSMGLGNITFDSNSGAFRSQFEAAPVDLVEGVDVLKHAKMAEIGSLKGYFGKDAFKKRAPHLALKGDVVAIGYVPQRKAPVTAMVVTGPKKGQCFHVSLETFGFKRDF